MFLTKTKKSFSLRRGSALAEIVIGASIMLVGLLAINASYNTYIQFAFSNQRNIEANYLLQEGLEVFSFFRDVSWLNISRLSTSTTYFLDFNGTSWATTTSPVYVDGVFLRSITISDVYRDVSDDIATTGTYDPSIKLLTASIDYWQGKATTTKVLVKYLADIR